MAVRRRVHVPTDENRDIVSSHAIVGTRQEVIADILGIDPKTLRKHYREELDQSLAKANAVIAGSLYGKALGGDTAAMIFWLKTRARWRETDRADDPQQTAMNISFELPKP